MGLIDRFRKVEIPAPTKEEMHAISEAMMLGGLPAAIEAAIQKQIDNTQYFQAYENADDGGNYFGQEFNIRATAGRIKSTYTREPWIFACATVMARALSSIPYIVKDAATGEVTVDHPLNAKINASSPIDDALTTNWKGNLDLVLGGNYFRVFDETFTRMMHVPVELCSIKMNNERTAPEYLMIYDAERTGSTKLVPYRQVIQHKYPNPSNSFYGLSIFTAASRPIILDRYKNEFEMAFYLRGATNSGVIEATEDINKTRLERLMKTFEQVYTGKRNWWRTIFLPKGAKWNSTGLTMSEMQHLEGLRENRLTILATLGIPPSLVGLVQDVNRATAEVQERIFWMNTIKPIAEFIAGGWNNSYLVKTIYSGRVKVEPDFSDIQALQGSLITKGEQAKSVEGYFWIDEIRKEIFGKDPLPNGSGEKFVAEVKSSGAASPFGVLSAPAATPPPADPATEVIVDTALTLSKAAVVRNQEKIETRLSSAFKAGYDEYLGLLLTYAAHALRENENVETYLRSKSEELAKRYMVGVERALELALLRGFSFANSQTKEISDLRRVKAYGASVKQLRFREIDEQAIDALKEEQKATQKERLVRRGFERFLGFNKTRTDEILTVIEEGLAELKTPEQIAATIRAAYGERYKNQASTIVRTELLGAISQGIKWNHDVLGEVFSEVKKQWFHVGDGDSNPDARERHVGFDAEGPVPNGYKWGGTLEYPRDPSAPADDVINCRCSMVSVIPDDAESNAEVILDKV